MTLSYIPSDTNDEGIFKATASGVLPNGKPVVVNADGTVSVVGIGAASLGSIVQFDTTNSNYISTVYDSNSNKVVIVYRDGGNSNYGTAIVGTISGASISFGSAVVFYSGNAQYISATFDSNLNKVVIAYQDVGGSVTFYGTAVVGTVSGASISFGSAVVFRSANSSHISATFDTTSNKVVIAYSSTNSSLGSAIVGTVSGASISFGSETVWESSAYQTDLFAVYDANANRVVIAYRDDGDSGKGKAIVGTVSGTSISFGSKVVFEATSTQYPYIVYDSTNNRVVIAYMDGGDGDKGKAVIGTVSGTSISFNTATVFYDTAGVSNLSASYNSNAGAVVISFRGASAYGLVLEGATTSSSINFGSPLTITTNAFSASYSDSVYDPISKKVVIAYVDQDDSGNGKAVVYSSAATNLTAENYIGISTGGTYASGSTATVKIIGNTSNEQTSLTAGQAYYVQTDGTIGTTAADPSVFAGTAISATRLIVKT